MASFNSYYNSVTGANHLTVTIVGCVIAYVVLAAVTAYLIIKDDAYFIPKRLEQNLVIKYTVGLFLPSILWLLVIAAWLPVIALAMCWSVWDDVHHHHHHRHARAKRIGADEEDIEIGTVVVDQQLLERPPSAYTPYVHGRAVCVAESEHLRRPLRVILTLGWHDNRTDHQT